MIVGVQDVYYFVQDMQRALRFYRDALGLPVTSESDHWTTLRVDDIRATVARLQAAVVKFLGPIDDASWGRTVPFEDPDGNVLKLMQPAP